MMIHIDRGGERMGPYSLEEVNRYLADGTLQASDLGWYDGAAGWVPVTNIEGVVAVGAVPPPSGGAAGSACPACQAPVEANQIVCMGCGTRLKEAPVAGGGKGSKTILIAVGSVVLIAGIVLGITQPWKSSVANGGGKTAKPSPPDVDIIKAAADGNLEAIKQHIAAGTDLDQRAPNDQSTPLMMAALFGRTEVAKALIEAGAKLDLKKNDGSTALMNAAFFCHTELVQALLDKGADKNIRNNIGSTPLQAVEAPLLLVQPFYGGSDEAIFKPAGMPLDMERIKSTRPKIAKMLGGGGGAPQPAGSPPITDLMGAVFYEDLAAVKKFIAAGADINAPKPDDGNTPLHTAAFVCNIEIVKALIAAKANVNAKNRKGETPLLVVVAPWEAMPGIYGFVGALLQKKFDLARIQNDRVKVAEILRAAGAQ